MSSSEQDGQPGAQRVLVTADLDDLVPRVVPGDNPDVGAPHPERRRQSHLDCRVGLPLDGPGAYGDEQRRSARPVPAPADRVGLGAGTDPGTDAQLAVSGRQG